MNERLKSNSNECKVNFNSLNTNDILAALRASARFFGQLGSNNLMPSLIVLHKPVNADAFRILRADNNATQISAYHTLKILSGVILCFCILYGRFWM